MSEEKSNVLTNHIESKKVIELIVIAVITAIVWNLPQSYFGIDGLTVIQQRVIAVFVFATLSWLTEAIPLVGNIIRYHYPDVPYNIR